LSLRPGWGSKTCLRKLGLGKPQYRQEKKSYG
jgi:hypothetical protein